MMCAVSMVYDHYGKDQGWGQAGPTIPFIQQPYDNKPIDWSTGLPQQLPWTPDVLKELKQVIERLDAIDKKLGLAHCEDPNKAKWMAEIEAKLQKEFHDKLESKAEEVKQELIEKYGG